MSSTAGTRLTGAGGSSCSNAARARATADGVGGRSRSRRVPRTPSRSKTAQVVSRYGDERLGGRAGARSGRRPSRAAIMPSATNPVGLRLPGGDRQQPQQPGVPLGVAARRAGRCAARCHHRPGGSSAEPASDCGAPQLTAVDADETQLARRVPQLGDGPGDVLPVALADPVGVPAEALHGSLDDGRGQVAGAGELHAVADPVQEPPVRLDHIGLRSGWLPVEPGLLHHPEQFGAARAAERVQQFDEIGSHAVRACQSRATLLVGERRRERHGQAEAPGSTRTTTPTATSAGSPTAASAAPCGCCTARAAAWA